MFRELLKTGILFSRKEKHENMFDYGLFSKQVLKNCWRLFNISRGISPNTRITQIIEPAIHIYHSVPNIQIRTKTYLQNTIINTLSHLKTH